MTKHMHDPINAAIRQAAGVAEPTDEERERRERAEAWAGLMPATKLLRAIERAAERAAKGRKQGGKS